MSYNFIRVPSNARSIPCDEIEKIRVDREDELINVVHLTAKANENVLLIGDRGQGKTFLAILLQMELRRNHPEIFTVKIDLTALHFIHQNDNYFIELLPALILDQLCKEIWVTLLGNDYSKLLSSYDIQEMAKIFKTNSEKRLLEIYSILKREEQRYRTEFKSMMLGIKSEINSGEMTEWRNRSLQNFELLELIKELKNTILKEHSLNKIILICDEANKLTEKEQLYILQNYLDFFGANQFNFLLVASNFDNLKASAEQSGLFRVIELEGFTSSELVRQLINKSFLIEDLIIEDDVYTLLFEAFTGNLRLSLDAFMKCIILSEKNKIINKKIAGIAIGDIKEQIRRFESIKLKNVE